MRWLRYRCSPTWWKPGFLLKHEHRSGEQQTSPRAETSVSVSRVQYPRWAAAKFDFFPARGIEAPHVHVVCECLGMFYGQFNSHTVCWLAENTRWKSLNPEIFFSKCFSLKDIKWPPRWAKIITAPICLLKNSENHKGSQNLKGGVNGPYGQN